MTGLLKTEISPKSVIFVTVLMVLKLTTKNVRLPWTHSTPLNDDKDATNVNATDEDATDEDARDEDATDEDGTDEDAMDADATDEEAMEEDATDEYATDEVH